MTKTQNKKRKGFTIVELVIVIAVIAILAGVLIPTFGGIIESANRSADIQLVAQINTILVVEEKLGGGVNDAVEIQKVIKENGLELKTKSKGQYIWYDIDAKKVVLAGLDANGIVLNDAPVEPDGDLTYVDASRPVLLDEGAGGNDGDASQQSAESDNKGNFTAATAPEKFIDGYLFISEKSNDGLADAIHTLRCPEGADPAKNITDAIAKIKKENLALGGNLESFMSTTAVMTKDGTFFAGENTANRVIVSSEMHEVTVAALNGLESFLPNIIVVDFHSDVTSFAEGVDDMIKSDAFKDVYFVYNNKDIEAVDTAEKHDYDIENLIKVGERNQYIQTLQLVRVDNKGATLGTPVSITEFTNFAFTYDFSYPYYGTKEKAYEFVAYSLQKSGANPISLGTTEVALDETEKMLISDDGTLNVYAVFEEITNKTDGTGPAFKVDGILYSSAMVTRMLANNAAELIQGTKNISVILGKSATLGSASVTSLTIPSGVTLWVPCSVTNYDGRSGGGIYHPKYNSGTTKTYGTFKKDEDSGVAKLTIDSNVTLTNNGYITVDAQLYQQGDSAHYSFIADDSSVLVVNGKIVNASGSRMEAYGVARTAANGEIIAESGSTVTEIMSVLDLHGGRTTIVSIKKGLSPFNNYTIDNIRLPLTIEYGAVYSAYGIIETSVGEHSMEFKIASSDGTPSTESADNPLFKMYPQSQTYDESKFVKSYEPNEGIKVTIYGKMEDCKKKISLGSVGDVVCDFTFAKVPMPLPNFDITIASGADLTISKATAYKVLPGSDIVVEEGGTLNLGCRVIVYDSFELNNVPSNLTARKYVTRNESGEIISHAFTELSASLLVKGTLVLENGAKFAGIVMGDPNDANASDTVKSKITVKSGAATSCEQINEGANGAYKAGCREDTIDEYTVIAGYDEKGQSIAFDWTGKWQSGLNDDGTIKYSQITVDTTKDVTYTYTGGIWSAQ